MKKLIGLAGGMIAMIAAGAQEPADALKFSWNVPTGTARVQAIGGAMGSLGGDVTSLFVNPAGLAFYRTGDFIFSPAYQFGKTNSQYLGRQEKDENSRFTWGATGFVAGGINTRSSNNSAFSIAITRTADFNGSHLSRGQNFQSSYSQKYLEEIGNSGDGNVAATGFPFGASLGFNTYWIDTVGGGTQGNFQFQSRALPLLATGLLQENSVTTRGGITELAMGGATELGEKLMLGGSLGIPFVFYEKDVVFTEADPTDNINNFDFAKVEDNLTTRGVGINLKAGLIYKPQEYWRLGLAFHSPTLFSLTDRNEVTVTTNTENYAGEQFISTSDVLGMEHEFKYYFHNPYRVIGSISYVLREIEDVTKQRGFITADVEYVNHKASSYFPSEESMATEETKSYLKSLNQAINNAYKGAFNFRVGGELKFTTIMVRAGAAYYSNPYKDIEGEKGHRLNLSGGLGYRNKGFFIDLSYVHAMTKDINFAYRLAQQPNNISRLENTTGNVYATVGLKF